MANAVIQYLILHDKEELQDLMEEIKDEIDAEFMDIFLDIEKLLGIFRRGIRRWSEYQTTNQRIVKSVGKFKNS